MIDNSWKKCLFKDIAQIEMGQSPSGDTYNEEGIGISLINGPTEFRARYPVKIQWTSKPTKICQVGDVLICVRGSSTGRINIANDNYCIGRGVAAIRHIDKKGSTPYLEYLLRFYSQQIMSRTGGSTFPNLDKQSLENMEILAAPTNEQCKIAEVLGVWDESIDLLERLIGKTRSRKQGLMQQLLTGKKRFKEFEGSEWRIVNLSDLCSLITKGTTPSSIGFEFCNEGINYIKIESINDRGQFLTEKIAKISEEAYQSLKRSQP